MAGLALGNDGRWSRLDIEAHAGPDRKCGLKDCGCAEMSLITEITAPRTFTTGATRDTDADKLDYEGFLSPLVLERFAVFMHKHRKIGDGMRAGDNWQAGIPRKAYMKSILRHVVELWRWHRGYELKPASEKDPQNIEEVLCAIMFNVQGLLFEILSGRDAGA